eukprot:gene32411-41101_t
MQKKQLSHSGQIKRRMVVEMEVKVKVKLKVKDAAEKEKSTNLSTGFVAAFEAEVREAYIEGQGEEAAAVSVSLPSGRVVSREDAAVGEEEATAGEEGATAEKEDATAGKEKD